MSGESPRIPPTRRMPQQPNLEQLGKQAKDLLAQYRASESDAVDEVQRFEREPKLESFALNDAQRVLARAYGFASWPRLKAFVDGVNVHQLAEAAKAGDLERARALLAARPELAQMDLAGNNEHRALHFAVLRRDAAMTRLLMEAGADARQGIFPHRDATAALAIAREREYGDIVAVIEEVESERRRALSCPNATISPVQDQIAAAIRAGENEAAMQLLERDRSLMHACDREGATPLHIAAEEANEAMVNWLLERGANPNKRDAGGHTPIERAALAIAPEFAAMAERLIAHGAEIGIYAAVALGNGARVRELIEADRPALRRIGSGGGLLTLAVRHDQIEMVRLLLDSGADVDERIFLEHVQEPTLSQGMPLWHAATSNQFEIAKLLLDRGADPNSNVYASGWPLWRAWNHADGRLKNLLIERGAKMQPYMIVELHDVEAARRLLAEDSSDELVRELAWSSCDKGCPEILEMALARLGLAGDERWWHWVIIQPIRGATAEYETKDGHYACMAALLKHGVDPNVARYGQTALHFAAAYRGSVSDEDRARFAEMLIDAGARIDVRDDLLKSTPLGWACRWGRRRMAEALIARGAPVEEPDAEPWATPKAWARKMGRSEIAALLEK